MAETRLAIRELLRCSSCDDSSASFVTTCGRLLSVSRVVVVDPCLENVHGALKIHVGRIFPEIV